jgi:hypothetical protein
MLLAPERGGRRRRCRLQFVIEQEEGTGMAHSSLIKNTSHKWRLFKFAAAILSYRGRRGGECLWVSTKHSNEKVPPRQELEAQASRCSNRAQGYDMHIGGLRQKLSSRGASSPLPRPPRRQQPTPTPCS